MIGRRSALVLLALMLLLASRGDAEPDKALLIGRVFQRGTITPLPDVRVVAASGESTTTDGEGRFELRLGSGEIQLLVADQGYQPLRVVERLKAGEGLKVEYRLTPIPGRRRKYETTVRGEERHEGDHFTIKDEELHNAPGTLGDPFRIIGLLPGVATPLPLLPFYVIRGGSPGSTGIFLDGMQVPQLFHFLLLSAVVHPQLVDRVDFYPGAYDVSFGRFAGGVIDAETLPARSDGQHGQVELRLYDISTLGEIKLPHDVHLEVAGRYGYPALLIKAFDNRANLQYWDFQLRLDWKGLTVEALGSFDSFSFTPNDPSEDPAAIAADTTQLRLSFYRVQVRDRERRGNIETEAALVGSIDEMASFGGTGVRKLGVGWRFNLRAKWRRFRLFVGTDGELSRFNGENFSPGTPASEPDALGELSGDRNGVVAGTFAEGTVDLVPRRLSLTAGARLDVYHAGNITLLGIDPRISARAKLLPWLILSAGFGLYQQPPSFPVALPGIDTFALQLGLQRAWQGQVKVEAELPQSISFSLTGFYQRFANVNDVVLDLATAVCTAPPPESLSGLPAQITRQLDGQSYGMELLLRRKIGRFTGWIAYTLSRSERIYSCGLRPADFDQTHLLNVVLQVRLPWNLLAGGRLYVATGRPTTVVDPTTGLAPERNNSRLPDYVQLDVRLDREWLFNKWALDVFLEVVNLTDSENILGIRYPRDKITMMPNYLMPEHISIRLPLPSIGLRARF